MRLEWRALARALGASGAARTSAIADALAFRAARHQRFPGAAAEEHAVDINEGIATYTQYVTGSDSVEDARRHATATLTASETSTSFVRTFAYASGAGYGLLLDALSPGWHRKITAASDFGQLLSAAARVTAAPDAAAVAARYDSASLRAAEEQRDREQQAIIAELRRRFVDGPGAAASTTWAPRSFPERARCSAPWRTKAPGASSTPGTARSSRPTARPFRCRRPLSSMRRR